MGRRKRGAVSAYSFRCNKEGKESESISSCSSSNRKHIKRRRIHIDNGTKLMSEHIKRPTIDMQKRSLRQLVGEAVAQADALLDGRMVELHGIWSRNRDGYLNVLERLCNRDITMVAVQNDRFWGCLTRELVSELNLDLEITNEVVESCKRYGLSLQKLHKECERNNKKLKNIERICARESSETKKKLFNIFGRKKLEFKEGLSSGGSSRKSSRKSSRSSGGCTSNPSVRIGCADLDLTKEVGDVIAELVQAKVLKFEEIEVIESYFYNSRASCNVFLKYTREERVDTIKWILGRSTH